MYDFKVCVKSGKLVYVVYISSPVRAGVLFFKSVNELFAWAEEERKKYKHYGYEFEFKELNWDKVRTMIEEVLTDEHYRIGENGRTYYE